MIGGSVHCALYASTQMGDMKLYICIPCYSLFHSGIFHDHIFSFISNDALLPPPMSRGRYEEGQKREHF